MTATIYFKGNVQSDEPNKFIQELNALCYKHDAKAELDVEK
jgi:hypothetical protein